MMQILAHQSRFADTVRPSKKMFLVRRVSERAQEECSKFCLLERAPQRLLFFDFKLRKFFEGCALWIKSQQQNCVFRKSAAELICVRPEFKAILFNTHFNTHTLLLLTIYIYIKSISARKQQVLVEAGGDNWYSSQ